MKVYPDKPAHHGRDHRPGGEDPTKTGPWIEVGAASAWDSGTTYTPGHKVSHGEFNFLSLQTSTGIEPEVTTHWENYWIYDSSVFLNGGANVDDDDDADEDTVAYRLVVGPPSDYANGDTIDDSQTHLHLKGVAVGVPLGSAIYRLIPGYRPPKNRRYAANDEFGGHICLTVDANGYVYRGFV